MFSVTKEFTFDAAHRLMNHKGLCANLHGHTYKVLVTLSSESLNCDYMVVDFAHIKENIWERVLKYYDHSVILNVADTAMIKFLEDSNCRVYPYNDEPTAENMAFYIANSVSVFLPNYRVEVTVYETPTSSAKFSMGPV